MKNLKGKVAFITGGGSGVALGQAKVFAEEAGMKVVIADIRQQALDDAMDYFSGKGVQVHPILLDLTDREAYARAADEAERIFGPVDLLCNTAGVSQFGPIADATFDDWDWQMDVNVKGVINGCMTFIPRMIKRGEGGHILITASMSAFVALPTTAIYCTTKYAVRGLAESLRVEMPEHDIGVSLLCPGAVNTNIHRAVETRPEKYAKTGYYGADEEVFGHLKAVIKDGFDPVDLGRVVRDAVEANQFWVLPYPEFVEGQHQRDQEVVDAMLMYQDHPDSIRRAKMREEMGQNMPGQ
ncbi:SDR family oxidoreductase [Altericroceibacterium endophyticum]|uniref:SDR family NAD(P)-dependent oxidoreductase n=1 Tax=Altericroceibacterium endophyticum TaxID=1808508 RepID=A0A6I4T0I6_9SPHN|nr:SDR family NAD(P)-dependent oxidoreductase [Altericroceibacterium endophyticum]MXO64406.1 SDR family NAD(P)-dependent oxidoreductase [Altericroceibacterium endophyticum]